MVTMMMTTTTMNDDHDTAPPLTCNLQPPSAITEYPHRPSLPAPRRPSGIPPPLFPPRLHLPRPVMITPLTPPAPPPSPLAITESPPGPKGPL